MSHILNGIANPQMSVGKDGVAEMILIRSEDITASCHADGMLRSCAALRMNNIVITVNFV